MSTPRKQPTDRKPATAAKKAATGRVTAPKRVTPTTAAAWKMGNTIPLEVPSGNTALVRNPGMQAFLTAGLIPNSLLPIVTEALERGTPPSGRVLSDKLKAEGIGAINDIMDMVDAVTVYCVVQPKVYTAPRFTEVDVNEGDCTPEQVGQKMPQDSELRDPELLYVDDVDLADKMFIFQWSVGGTRDLESFREQYANSMAAVQPGEDVEPASKPTPARRR